MTEGSVSGKKKKDIHGILTGNVEWYTPAKYVESARKVMGSIDLDPATSLTAQERVNAKRFFTAKHDGLIQDWSGNVWLNPPYKPQLITKFAVKMAESWRDGSINAGIMLTNSATDTSWWHIAATASTSACFTSGRIKFLHADGTPGASPAHGQTFFYFGRTPELFRQEFSQYGLAVQLQEGT
jgi:phage N-6-adenine-methyltransferase